MGGLPSFPPSQRTRLLHPTLFKLCPQLFLLPPTHSAPGVVTLIGPEHSSPLLTRSHVVFIKTKTLAHCDPDDLAPLPLQPPLLQALPLLFFFCKTGICVFLALLLHYLYILKTTNIYKNMKITFLYPSFLLIFSTILFFLSGECS